MVFRPTVCIVFILVGLQAYQALDIPNCEFEDTVDLTHAQVFPNGSYLYGDDIIVPPDQVGIYNYEIIYDAQRIPREPHPRGCVCKEGEGGRSCIKFCCHPTKEVIWNNTRECGDLYVVPKYDHTIKVISSNGTRRRINITSEFNMIMGIPCENASPLYPEANLQDKWDLFENGSLLMYYNLRLLTKRDFCMMPMPNEGGGDGDQWVLSPMVCSDEESVSASRVFNNIADVVSITFIILTILIVLVKPEKCNLQENCLICFLVSLAIGNTLMASIYISDLQLGNFFCSFMGFSGYFFSLVSFFWLNVIYFDLLKSIVNRENHFLTYSAYGWGVPTAITTVLIIVQYSNISNDNKPGIGVESCWFNAYNWSEMFYFHLLEIILLCLNIIYYYMTLRKMKETLKHQPTRKDDLQKSADQYGFLLIIMVTFCCVEIISNIESVLHPDAENLVWFFVTDFVCALEGPLIFWIFAVKPIIEARRRVREDGTFYDPLDEGITLADAPGFKSEAANQDYARF